jgi:hypothetical protein
MLVQARLSPSEHREFRRLARDLGFSDGEFIRAMLDVHVRVRAETIAAKAKAKTEEIAAGARAETVAAVRAAGLSPAESEAA